MISRRNSHLKAIKIYGLLLLTLLVAQTSQAQTVLEEYELSQVAVKGPGNAWYPLTKKSGMPDYIYENDLNYWPNPLQVKVIWKRKPGANTQCNKLLSKVLGASGPGYSSVQINQTSTGGFSYTYTGIAHDQFFWANFRCPVDAQTVVSADAQSIKIQNTARAELQITSPTFKQVLPVGQTFTLALEKVAPSYGPNPEMLDLRWEKRKASSVNPNEVVLQGASNWESIYGSPNQSHWNSFPQSIGYGYFQERKLYRVCIKSHGSQFSDWSCTQFYYGQPPMEISQVDSSLGLIKKQNGQYAQTSSSSSPTKIIQLGARTKMFKKNPLPLPPKVKQSNLWFDMSQSIAKPVAVLNKSFGAKLYVKNIGNIANGGLNNKVNLVSSCKAKTPGGVCKTMVKPPMPIIEPGKSKAVGHLTMYVIEKPGDYVFEMTIAPKQVSTGRQLTSLKRTVKWNISVKNNMLVKPKATSMKSKATGKKTSNKAAATAASTPTNSATQTTGGSAISSKKKTKPSTISK